MTMRAARWLIAGVLLSVSTGAGEIQVRWNKGAAEVSGVEAGALEALAGADWSQNNWRRLFPVYAEPPGALTALVGLPPMAGQYEIRGGRIVFTPEFPLEPGLAYRAVFRSEHLPGESGSGVTVSAAKRIPIPELERSTEVSAIYPSTNELPENLLKFYVHFSAPMSGGGIYDYITLRDEAGKAIELPFLELAQELWNPEMTRLTLFIDPGRIKRGVRPLEEIGPALEAGGRYSLEISGEWLDARGAALKGAFVKHFSVTKPDREAIDPERWEITAPPAGGRGALRIRFPGPLDHALARRLIWVERAGKRVPGKVSIAEGERVWTFTPDAPWVPGGFALAVQKRLEDLAGNKVGRRFEVDLFETIEKEWVAAVVRLPLDIR